MKKVLYVSNIEVPYRTEFFNQLSAKCDLTVLYERKKSKNRDDKWTSSVQSSFKKVFLKSIKIGNEFGFSFKILNYIFSNNYDEIIFGCYNSPVQIFSILLLNIFFKKYSINIDGDYNIEGNNIKSIVKRYILKGANILYIAGNKNSQIYKKYFNSKVISYNFSSLTIDDINRNKKRKNKSNGKYIIVVGQFFDYKGLDIAAQVAKKDQSNIYRFIGMGKKAEEFKKYVNSLNVNNIEIIPFLNKDELFNEYENCKLLILPSRKECWGLVINEAASFGCPIISTCGCGAAKEFLLDKYSCFLANSNDVDDLYNKIKLFDKYNYVNEYKDYLMLISKDYTIEKMVDSFLDNGSDNGGFINNSTNL